MAVLAYSPLTVDSTVQIFVHHHHHHHHGVVSHTHHTH